MVFVYEMLMLCVWDDDASEWVLDACVWAMDTQCMVLGRLCMRHGHAVYEAWPECLLQSLDFQESTLMKLALLLLLILIQPLKNASSHSSVAVERYFVFRSCTSKADDVFHVIPYVRHTFENHHHHLLKSWQGRRQTVRDPGDPEKLVMSNEQCQMRSQGMSSMAEKNGRSNQRRNQFFHMEKWVTVHYYGFVGFSQVNTNPYSTCLYLSPL